MREKPTSKSSGREKTSNAVQPAAASNKLRTASVLNVCDQREAWHEKEGMVRTGGMRNLWLFVGVIVRQRGAAVGTTALPIL
jgi:hypothetical protein